VYSATGLVLPNANFIIISRLNQSSKSKQVCPTNFG
jgi:hypothetical protein